MFASATAATAKLPAPAANAAAISAPSGSLRARSHAVTPAGYSRPALRAASFRAVAPDSSGVIGTACWRRYGTAPLLGDARCSLRPRPEPAPPRRRPAGPRDVDRALPA